MRRLKKQVKRAVKVSLIHFLAFCLVVNIPVSIALAGPENPQAVHGNMTFSKSGNTTTITQHTHKAIYNYSKFNISGKEIVNFIQPGASAAALNRILSANPTLINGTVNANGIVYFVNPAGVITGQGASFNVNQLVLSGLNISNQDFLSGNMRFMGGDGSVINNGRIQAVKAHLIGKEVINNGTISCPDGYVLLAAGDKVFLANNSSIKIEVAADTDTVKSGVKNAGRIDAAGGKIVLAAGDAFSNAIVNKGKLSASAGNGKGGSVELRAQGSRVTNKGTIEANSDKGKAGQIKMLGSQVAIGSGAVVEASGAKGGGEVLIGGDFQGKGETPTAEKTYVGKDAKIAADATENGDGGKVIVWADEATWFYGDASAKGGTESGDGGFIEISGKKGMVFDGSVSTMAANGKTGMTLFDPDNILIRDGAAAGGDAADEDPGVDFDISTAPGDLEIAEQTLEGLAAGTNITLLANDSITMEDLADNKLDLTQPATGGTTFKATAQTGSFKMLGASTDTIETSGGSVEIDAGKLITVGGIDTGSTSGDISLSAGIGITQKGGELKAGGDVDINAPVTFLKGNVKAGNNLKMATEVLTNGGELTGGNKVWLLDKVTSSGDLTVRADYDLAGASDGAGAMTAAKDIESGGNLTLGAAGNTITLKGNAKADNNLTLESDTFAVNGAGTTLSAGNDLTLEGSMTAGNDLSLKADHDLAGSSDNLGNVEAKGLVKSNAGSIDISASTNTIIIHNDVVAAQDVTLNQNVELVGAGDQTIEATAGTVDAKGTITKQAPASDGLNLTAGTQNLLADDVDIQTGQLNVQGDLVAKGNVEGVGVVLDGEVKMDAGSSQYISGGTGSVDAKKSVKKTVAGNLTIMGDTGVNIDGNLHAVAAATVKSAAGNINLAGDAVTGSGLMLSGPVIADGGANQVFDAGAGNLMTNKTVTKNNAGDLTLKAGMTNMLADEVDVQTGNLDIEGDLDAEDNLLATGDVHIKGVINNVAGNIEGSNVTIDNDIIMDGAASQIIGAVPGSVDAKKNVKKSGSGNLTIKGDAGVNVDGNVNVVEAVTIKSSGGDITPGENIIAASGIILEGVVKADGGATQNFDAGTGNLLANNSITKNNAGGLNMKGDNIDVQSIDVNPVAAKLNVNAQQNVDINGDVNTKGDINTTGGNDVFLGGNVNSTGNTVVKADEDMGGVSDGTGSLTQGAGVNIDTDGWLLLQSDQLDMDDIAVNNKATTELGAITTAGGFVVNDGENWTSGVQAAGEGNVLIQGGSVTVGTETFGGESQFGQNFGEDGAGNPGGLMMSNSGGVTMQATGPITTKGFANLDNANIIGSSDHLAGTGVTLPYDGTDTLKAAVVIRSQNTNINIGSGTTITANGTYYQDGSVDDRPGAQLLDTPLPAKDPGDPFDIAVYIESANPGGTITVNSAVQSNGGGVVIDSQDTVELGKKFLDIIGEENGKTNTIRRLELVSRQAETLQMAFDKLPGATDLAGFDFVDTGLGGDYVLRGGTPDAWVLALASDPPLPEPGQDVDLEAVEAITQQFPGLEGLLGSLLVDYEPAVYSAQDRYFIATAVRLSNEDLERLQEIVGVLDDTDDTYVNALDQALSTVRQNPDVPPTTEELANIDTEIANRTGEANYYALAKQWTDAYESFVYLLDDRGGLTVDQAIAIARSNYPKTDNTNVNVYAGAKLEGLRQAAAPGTQDGAAQ